MPNPRNPYGLRGFFVFLGEKPVNGFLALRGWPMSRALMNFNR